MRKILNIAKWGATLGREPQNFLGAKWIRTVLERTPESKKRIWALRMLSLSPHYFINPDDPQYSGMSHDEYLEAVSKTVAESREKIYQQILKPHFREDDTALDYGCGPGFLAKVVSGRVKKIYACDISEGALACARIINSAPNLEYVTADDRGLAAIPDGSVDIVFSFAMVQHISDEIFEIVLENMRRKLKPGGRLVLHIQLTDDVWKTEDEWRSDNSIQGKIKFKYGLHCFGRTADVHKQIVEKHGFTGAKVVNIADIVPEIFDDVCSQSLLTAT